VSLRIGGGQGFYGDSVRAVSGLLEDGVDYLCLEALAELTLAILAGDRARDETLGYTRDLPDYLALALPYVATGRTRVITNAGGINPLAAARAAHRVADALGLPGIRIATVLGDDLTARLGAPELGPLVNTDTGQPFGELPAPAVFAAAYLGARPIVDALAAGAQVVITGRVADPALFLAPLVHEFGWSFDDDDRLAAGVAVGHLCECAGQSVGGNFAGQWWTVPHPWDLPYPIAECEADGTAVLTKPAASGGRVDFDTARAQLLYEVGDPAAYVTPDVVADFTALRLEELGPDRVRVSGARGGPAPARYKVLVGYQSGWTGEARVAFGWPDAYAKARATEAIFARRVAAAGFSAQEWLAEYWGVNALHGPAVPDDGAAEDAPEVLLRVAWRTDERESAERIGREMVPLALSGPAWGMTGFGRGPTRPSRLIGLWPTLVPRSAVDAGVRVG
jgi:hypothetical protein